MFAATKSLFSCRVRAAPSIPIATLYIKGVASSSANTVAIPTHVVGDLIVIYSCAKNSATAPSVPSQSGTVPTWSTIQTGPGTSTVTGRTADFVATAPNHTSGTWTGATGMIAVVISRQNSSPIGGSATTAGGTLDATAPAVTMIMTDGSSLLLHFFGVRSGGASATWGAPPTGYTQQIAESAGCVCLDTKDDTTSDGSVTQTRTSATVGYDGQTVEILRL